MFRVFLRPLFLLAFLAVFFACHLTQSGKTEPVFDFPTLKSTIGDADHATIILKDSTGKLIDTLFHASVTPSTTFRGLAAPGYDGGKATLHIEATKNGEVVYKVERGYDGKAGGNQGHSIIQVSPGTTLDIEWILPRIREGESIALPVVKIQPSNLSDKSLSWLSREPHLLAVTATHLQGLAPGTAVLVVVLKSDTTKKDSLAVEIVARNTPSSLDSLSLSPDPLMLALRGPTGRFSLTVKPATASKEVAWTSLDPSVVSVSEDGSLSPLSEGLARIVATSTAEPTISDTARVQVGPPLKVDSVRLLLDSLEVFANGSPEELSATVHPLLANPKVLLLSRDPSMVQVESTKVQGLKEGETYVQVRSVEDEGKTDSLKVIVFPSQKVDSVRVTPDTLRLYVNGESLSLKASIHPSTLQSRFTWSSGNLKVAAVDGAGKVSPSGEGKTYVSARARADASRKDSSLIIVKKDTPRLWVGSDTVISAGTTLTFRPEAPQDYGLVTLFKWDLTGDGDYDDSSATLKSELTQHYAEVKDYEARFYVRDTEGNDTVVVRRVKAVNGRVVQITSPKDGAFVNTTPITVAWTVDGNSQSNSQALNPGANTVIRSAQDSAGQAYSHSITVHLDQTAPNRPTVRGSLVPVNTLTPEWRWSSGGGGGNGIYRYRIGDPDLSAQAPSPDTFFTAPSNLAGGTHTLYVQERDEAGNWSANGSFAVRIDTTAPPAPTVSVMPPSPSSNARPTWTWTGGTGDAYRYYRYKLDNDDFRSGAKDTTGTTFTPNANLSDTVHTLYVQERDSAGNWSATASRSIAVDTQRPAAPMVSVSPAALTNDDTPTWSWTAVPEATGYRFKVNDANLEAGATETTGLSHTPVAGLGEGTFTLFVQARDAAGNWSVSGSRQVRIDLTPPTAPRIDSTPYSPLNTLQPRWTWRSGTGGARVFRARVDDPDLAGQPEQQDSSFTPGVDLSQSAHHLYVQERDSAGNWSVSSSRRHVLSLQETVGPSGFASGGNPVMDISSTGVPYVAFVDGDKPAVRRYVNGNWELVGSPGGLASEGTYNIRIALDPQDIPHIVFIDTSNIIRGRRLFGSDWVDTELGYSANGTSEFGIAFDAQGNSYVAYVHSGFGIRVQKNSGSGWERLGTEDFGVSGFSEFGVTQSGQLFVLLADFGDFQAKVFTLAGNSWVSLPTIGTFVSPYLPDLAISNSGQPYVAYYSDEGSVYSGKVVTYESGAWKTLLSDVAPELWLKTGKSGKLYRTNATGNTLFVSDGQNWSQVGKPLPLYARRHTFVIDSSGIPYIAESRNGKITVVKTSFDP